MNDFIPGQRWISNAESELGLGLILEVESKRVTVLFLACGEKRLYARDNAPLTRVMFSPGDRIESADHCQLTISKVIEQDGLISYIGEDENGRETQLEEIDLNHHIQFNKPQDRFFAGQVDPSEWFLLRYETWKNLQRLQQSPVRGLIGGRTSLIPHQLYIASEVAKRHVPRIMLADEVGLGKTIEAGLVLHHRLINGLTNRALIIVPETLVHQWLVEMLRRFNLYFSIFDEERCIEADGDNPFLSGQLILCSLNFFSANRHRQQQALEAGWDMVIVDEAHHLEWNEQDASPEYQFVEKLGRISPGLILLTATPEQLGKESHFARLRLLDPDRFYSFEQFIEEERDFEPVARAARLLLEKKPLDNDFRKTLAALLKQDNVENLLQKIHNSSGAGIESARDELINVLLDYHGTGRVLFRNSRQTVQGFPQRQLHGVALTASQEQQTSDHLQDDPRFGWLIGKVQDLTGQKALLICRHAQTALELERTLRSYAGIHAAVFHEGLSIIERDRAAAYFADPESSAQLLICSEIGSEGRNFQFAHHLVLFDLPENPDLLQQRIGRLDRIGQKHVIQIHVPYILNSGQHLLFRWYDEGLNAFRKNCSAAQQVYQLQKEELSGIVQLNEQSAVDQFIEKTKCLAKELEAKLHDGRDQLLELNSCREEHADELIGELNNLESGQTLWPFMDRLFDCYGVDVEYHSAGCQILKPGNHMRVSHFPELPEDGITITVDRKIALVREDMQFLTWEHPMVSAAMDLVKSSATGNAAISIVKHNHLDAAQFLLEVLFIVECSAPVQLQIARFLPPTPIRILIDQQCNDLTNQIEHDSFIETEQPIEVAQLSGFLGNQRGQINKMLKIAEEKARHTMLDLVNKSCRTMLDVQGNELKRLGRLKKVNPNIKEEEIEGLKDIIQASYDNIQASRLKLDAARLVITS